MKRLAAFLIFLLAGSLVPVGLMSAEENQPVATFHVVAGQEKTITAPHVTITFTGNFGWDSNTQDFCAGLYTSYDDGAQHSVCATTSGETDPNQLYLYVIKNIQLTEWTETKELAGNEQDDYYLFLVKNINALTNEVTIEETSTGNSREVTLTPGEETWVYGVPKAKVHLEKINVGLFSTTATFKITYYKPVEADIVVYPYQSQGQQPSPSPTKPQENQSNQTTPQKPFIDPTKVPAIMIVVGEHAAGADVAAGAKVGIAVQKWIDESDSLIEWLPLPSTVVKAYKELKKSFIRADAMLDTEVTDPNKIAPIVYSVGGPVANQYSAMLNNRTGLPVRFVKENSKWYLVSKYGDKWSGSYGVIEIIPAARTPEEMKEHLINGDFKLYDVLVAGLDRKGTYAACKLLNANFMGMLTGKKPDPRLIQLITLQAQLNMLFSGYLYLDQANAVAIVVDENGQIVKVVVG